MEGGGVEEWRCGGWWCGGVEEWRCGGVEGGGVEEWRCGGWWCGGVEVWRSGGVEVWRVVVGGVEGKPEKTVRLRFLLSTQLDKMDWNILEVASSCGSPFSSHSLPVRSAAACSGDLGAWHTI